MKKIAKLQEKIANNKEVLFVIKAFPNSLENSVKELASGEIQVRTTTSATDNKANQAIVKLLATTLGLRRYQVEVVKGKTTRIKTIKLSR